MITAQHREEVMYDTPGTRASMVSFLFCIFHAPLKPSQIQFKCKATQDKKVFMFAIYSISPSAITKLRPMPQKPISTDQPDHSIASDWLLDTLDLYLIWMDHPFALVPPFRFFNLFSSCCLLWLNRVPQRKSVSFPLICPSGSDTLQTCSNQIII